MKWWQYLDWSRMKRTFNKLSENHKWLINESGFWSLGKGNFEEMKENE